MFEQVRSEASMTALLIVVLAALTAATSIAHEGEREDCGSHGLHDAEMFVSAELDGIARFR